MNRLAYCAMLLVLAAPTLAFAGACATPTVVVADGRITDFDFVAAFVSGTSGDNYYQFDAVTGRSYSVEVRQDYDDKNTDLTVILAAPGGTCPTLTQLAGTTDTTQPGFEPGVSANTTRESFLAAATGTYVIWVHNANTVTGRYISVSVANTSLYSPRWAKFTGYFTAWGFQNNTNAALSGSLTLFNSNGTQAATETFTIPAGQVVFRDTQNSANFTGVSGAGYAKFTHNGPAGAVTADSFIDSTSGLFIQPVKFGVREK